jgi:hypothetical protein
MNKISLGVLLLSCSFSNQILAGPADYIYTPTVEFGERELDIKFGQAEPLAGNRAQVTSVGYGYSARENWFTEFYLKDERNGTTSTMLAEWENRFQLTETGQYPVDFGIVTELEIPVSGTAPKEIKVGGLFQTEFGKLQLNGNVLFERAFGQPDEDGAPFSTNLNYQWQAKYRWQPELEFGVQGFAGMGKWNDWSQQSTQANNIGPAVFGKIKLENRRAIKYNAAWLKGSNSNSPNHTFRTQIEYEFF